MPQRRPRVVYWNNIPSPYVVERFNALARRDTVEFEAWFNERLESDRSWDVDEGKWLFRYRYLPKLSLAGRHLNLPTPLLGGQKLDLLISLYAEPSFLAGFGLTRRLGIRHAFYCETTFDRWIRRYPWKEALKRRIFPRADAILTVGDDSRRFALRYGASPERVLFIPPVIDAAFFTAGRVAALPERDAIRRELGLHGVTFLNVGRLWRGKGLDYLLDAFAVLQRRCEGEVSLLFVGDGVDEAHFRRRCLREGLQNVVFAGFHQKPELPRFYAAADAFVFPTLGDPYGLVVDEAMACSLPIISSTEAGEIRARVENGVTGYLVPPENSAALLESMDTLVRDPGLRERMGMEAAIRIAGSSPDAWAQQFERDIAQILSSPPA